MKSCQYFRNNKNKGMVIPLVLVFATISAILATFILKSNIQTSRQNQVSYYQLQAAFAAKAGMQHALLKVKHLHRELFDAACLAQGRNPLFDFSKAIDMAINPGPKYCIYSSDATPNSYGYISPNDLASKLSGTLTPPNRWLDVFREDISSKNTVMNMAPLPDAIKNLMREPFTGQYETTRIEVMAQDIQENTDQNRVSNQIVVKITVVATINYPRFYGGVQDTFTEEYSRTVRVSRDRSL